MNPLLALAMTILGAGLLLALPLAPALAELHRKSDALPLNVVQQHAGEIRHFADGFRNYVGALQPILERCRESGASASGTMRDGVQYLALGRSGETGSLPVEGPGNCQVLIAAAVDLHLPSGIAFARDIFSSGDIVGGTNNQYRAMLGERNVHLASSSTVMRWVHANGEFQADAGCRLYGRVSSDRSIRLAEGCTFQRLNAPRVELGGNAGAGLAAVVAPMPGEVEPLIPNRHLHDGDLELGNGEVFRGNLIVRGELHIGQGAKIHGSIKCEKDLFVEDNVAVSGSLISERQMVIGQNCSIHGPVIAEREIFIGSGTQCGTAKLPTSVCAPRIAAEEGILVFGTLWARELGRVVAK